MPEQLTFLALAKKVLEENGRALSVAEIWNIAEKSGLTKQLKSVKAESQPKTPIQTLNSTLSTNAKKEPSDFARFETEPFTYYLKSSGVKKDDLLSDAIDNQEEIFKTSNKVNFLEIDLHPFVAYYFREMNVVVKTIGHYRSVRKGGSFKEWLHPDMIGASIPFSTMEPELIDFTKTAGVNVTKIYAVEIKRTLNFGNLRESFFQAVSNSSWANEGYLAAADIDDSDEFQTELGSLSVSFGIGVIWIDLDDPDDTVELFPARPREEVDWPRLNKIANINSDARTFLSRARDAIQSKHGKETLDVWFDPAKEKDVLISEMKKVRRTRKGESKDGASTSS